MSGFDAAWAIEFVERLGKPSEILVQDSPQSVVFQRPPLAAPAIQVQCVSSAGSIAIARVLPPTLPGPLEINSTSKASTL